MNRYFWVYIVYKVMIYKVCIQYVFIIAFDTSGFYDSKSVIQWEYGAHTWWGEKKKPYILNFQTETKYAI